MKYLLYFILILLFARPANGQQALLDSLKTELPGYADDTNKIKLLGKLSYSYHTVAPDSGLMYAYQMLALAGKLKWEKGTAQAYNNLGTNYNTIGNADSALLSYQKALSLFQKLKLNTSVASVLSNLAGIYAEQGNHRDALSYYFKALDIYEAVSNDVAKAMIFHNIGSIYLEQKDYAKATSFYKNAQHIYQANNNQSGIAGTQINLGIVYSATGKYEEALTELFSALATLNKVGNKKSARNSLASIGDTYLKMGDYTNALKYQRQALVLSREIGSVSGVAINTGNIGETWFKIATSSNAAMRTEALQNAIYFLSQAVIACRAGNLVAPLVEYEEYLSKAYAEAGDHKKAYEHLAMHAATKDSFFSVQNKMELARIEAQREIEIKKRDLLLKDKQTRINNLNTNLKQNRQQLLITSIVLLLFIIGIGLKYLRNYQQKNRELRNETEKQLSIIETQTVSLQTHRNILRDISYMHAHSVRGPVATILGLTQLFNYEDITDPINQEIVNGITKTAEQLDAVVKEIIRKDNADKQDEI